MIIKQNKEYEIVSLLGQGGMALVYLALDSKFGLNVAIKVLNKDYIQNDNIRNRFIEEAKRMFRMSHPNIVKVTDLIDDGYNTSFVMEFIEGETLKQYIERKGRLSNEEIKSIFVQILDALSYVHKKNIIHRDIKPSNFMIDSDGKVKLMDFGISKTTNTTSIDYTQTGLGVQMGTPLYMSPEQAENTQDVTYASDIYSLGVVLWQMVMGEKPYGILTLTNTIWDNIIIKATQKISENRYQSCFDFLEEINLLNFDSDEFVQTKKDQFHSDIKTDIETHVNEESNLYPSVKIGKQIWMTENLDVDRFRNGDIIHEAKTKEDWKRAGQTGQSAWCYYENNEENGKRHGKLYNWYAVNDFRGLAPNGWQIPTVENWKELIDFLGEEPGIKLKSKDFWPVKFGVFDFNGEDNFDFKALPSGIRNNNGYFNNEESDYWTFDTNLNQTSMSIALKNKFLLRTKIIIEPASKNYGFSVRCVRN